MRKVILFIAGSLDRFIARPDGSVDWLFHDQDYGYQDFLDSIDTTLMGRKTYEQILTFGEFPYPDKSNYVFTRQVARADAPSVEFISQEIPAFVSELKAKPGKDIWLIGGGEINSLLLEHGLIDEMVHSVHPIFLGEGLPLFSYMKQPLAMQLIDCTTFESGLVQLRLSLNKP